MIFYRILGNDIPLRHGAQQTVDALAFILEREPVLPGCEKRFLLNRIVDHDTQARLAGAIEAAALRWDAMPFVADEFLRLDGLAAKARYLTNQNAARNRCIDLGLADAATVMPFDGQTFFTEEGWHGLRDALAADADARYMSVPMFRLFDNARALGEWARPLAEDEAHIRTEPQVLIRRGHDVRFNPHLTYGQANKVELLMRLGIPGPWDGWTGPLFDSIRADVRVAPSRSFGRVRDAGFVFRLESGNPLADRDQALRSRARLAGLQALVRRVEESVARLDAGERSA
ncbi:MAG: hypothetical protein ABI846_00540 [Rudaea sp.]